MIWGPLLFRIHAMVISLPLYKHGCHHHVPPGARQSGAGGDKVIWSSRSQQIYLIAQLQLPEQKLS